MCIVDTNNTVVFAPVNKDAIAHLGCVLSQYYLKQGQPITGHNQYVRLTAVLVTSHA